MTRPWITTSWGNRSHHDETPMTRSARFAVKTVAILACLGLVLFVTLYILRDPDLPRDVLAIMEQPDTYELLSLDPGFFQRQALMDDAPRNSAPDVETFYGWAVLGRMAISDPAVQKRLNEALREGIRGNRRMIAACFTPRHAIRAVKGTHVAEIIVCFQCLRVQVLRDGREIDTLLTTALPQPVFNTILRDAGIRVAD